MIEQLIEKIQICEAIRKSFFASKETYGSPRIHAELLEQGLQFSENTVAKYMNEMGLDGRLKKKFRVITTDSTHSQPIAPKLFETENHDAPRKPGQVLAGDITYLRIGRDFIYLAMRKLGPDSQIIFHSDRSSQYSSEAYWKMLSHKNIERSMSRKGNCYDSAYVESWFSSLQKEVFIPWQPKPGDVQDDQQKCLKNCPLFVGNSNCAEFVT